MGSHNLFAMFMKIRIPYAATPPLFVPAALQVESNSAEPIARQQLPSP
jgi:hypothetical protein